MENQLEWSEFNLPDISNSTNLSRIEPPDPTCEDEQIEKGPLLVTTWDQRCGFNEEMPLLNCVDQPCWSNDRAFAGCVPIAIAQIMRYYNYPTSYDWANMGATVGSTTTSLFIRGIWNAIPENKKDYDCDGTGVYRSFSVAGLLKNSYDYSSANEAEYNSNTVKNQLNLNRPVILSGGRDDGWWIFHSYADGYMWVCDGYRDIQIWSEDCSTGWGYLYFHMNWGWGGFEDGWYSYNNFNPSTFTFNYDVNMVYNIFP